MRLIIPLILALLTMSGQSKTNPDLTGIWLLDTKRSDLGRSPAPRLTAIRVDQSKGHLSVIELVTDQVGERAAPRHYLLDVSRTAVPHWTGRRLVLKSPSHPENRTLPIIEEWMLSRDTSTLIVRHRGINRTTPVREIFVFRRSTDVVE